MMTLKNYYRQQPQPIQDAERRSVPVYILRSNTITQMEQALIGIFQLPTEPEDAFWRSHERGSGRDPARAERHARSRTVSPDGKHS